MRGRVKSNEVKIYAPVGFKATWAKFLTICERDNQSASEIIRIWVEGYVARKDPSNPQRPITAFVKGHKDEEAAVRSSLIQELLDYATRRGMMVKHSVIVDLVRENTFKGPGRLAVIKAIVFDLKKLGVTTVY